MSFKDLIDGIRSKIAERKERAESRPVLDDDVTTDRYLKSLRRERRTQMEELEKVRLKQQIAKFKKERTSKHLFNLKQQVKNKKQAIVRRKVYLGTNIQLAQSNILKRKQGGI